MIAELGVGGTLDNGEENTSLVARGAESRELVQKLKFRI